MVRVRFIFIALVLFVATLAGAENIGQSLLSQGRIDDAIATLKQTLQRSPNDAQAHHLLSRAYYEVNDWDNAIAEAQRAVALQPMNSDYHLWLGRAYGEKAENSNFVTAIGLAKKVRTEFERAVQLNGFNLDARADLAEFYIQAPGIVGGGKDKARAEAESVASFDSPTAHWIQARLAEKEKKPAVAEREYKAAIQASNGYPSYWLALAAFYQRQGRLNEMEQAVNRATSAEIKKPDTWVEAAEVLYNGGRNFPAAVQYLRRYLSSNATVADAPAFQAHYLLGSIFERLGDTHAAMQEYRAALAMAREFDQARDAINRLAGQAMK
jgi:tetratricopeptide (TPR) repeat protein